MAQIFNHTLHILVFINPNQTHLLDGVNEILLKDVKEKNKLLIYLSASDFNKFLEVEYSKGRLLKRLIFYPRIFSFIENQIIMASVNWDSETIYIYSSEEGVWGVVINSIREKIKKKVYTVNIQHGIFSLQKTKFIFLRKLFNSFSRLIIGFPVIGLGFGGSKFDEYYVFGEKEKKHVLSTAKNALLKINPEICRFSVLKTYKRKIGYKTGSADSSKNILFAMQPIITKLFFYNEETIYLKLEPLFRFFTENDYKIIFRLHPGTLNKIHTFQLLKKSNLINYIEIDENDDISDSLILCDIVISFFSTVLFDAYLLGKIPIMLTGFFKEFDFSSPLKRININGNWQFEFQSIFNKISSNEEVK